MAMPPTVTLPPFSVVMEAFEVEVIVPPVMDEEDNVLALTVPPEMADVRRPATFTVPVAIPLVTAAFDEKLVVPAPFKVPTVMAPVLPVKFNVPFAVTVLSVKPVPERLAVAFEVTFKATELLRFTAFKVAVLFTVTPEVEAKAPEAVLSVPLFTVVAPVKVFAPVKVSEPEPVLMRLPVPEMTPASVPPETVRAVLPRAMLPPLSVVTVAVAPFKLAVPEVSVPIVAMPPTVTLPPFSVVIEASEVEVIVPPVMDEAANVLVLTVPPEMADVRRPATFTVPVAIPPVMLASDEKLVVPAPAREATVIAPVLPVKFNVPFAVIAPRVKPVPEILAVALVVTFSATLLPRSTAFKVAVLFTVTPEVVARAPAAVASVPAFTVVAPV